MPHDSSRGVPAPWTQVTRRAPRRPGQYTLGPGTDCSAGGLGWGACRAPDHLPVKVPGGQRPPGGPRTAGKVVPGVPGTDRQTRACLNPRLCRWLTAWIF